MTQPPQPLIDTIRRYAHAPASPLLQPLLAAVNQHLQATPVAIIAYGSCLRDSDPANGLADLYVVVDSYSDAYPHTPILRWLNTILPPNVFYLQCEHEGRLLRAKYAVISLADLEAGASARLLPTVWGRFAQPVRLLQVRDETSDHHICQVLATAVLTFLEAAAPLIERPVGSVTLWTLGLGWSYATELRPESRDRTRTLVRHNPEYYREVTAGAVTALTPALQAMAATPDRYSCGFTDARRRRARRLWQLRCWLGRAVSVARFCKGAITFKGGIDYAAWKIERHSGTPVEIPPRARKYPLVFGWGVLWRLLRNGVLR